MFNQIKTTFKNSFGNIIEWYDFSLYGYFATIIAAQFFTNESQYVDLIATFGAFADITNITAQANTDGVDVELICVTV